MRSKLRNQVSNNKSYFIFILLVLFVALIGMSIFSYNSFLSFNKNNQKILQKEANNIQNIIGNLFERTSNINSFLGKKIAALGTENLELILSLFSEADKIQNKSSDPISWTTFDWIGVDNLQVINSKIGILKNPVDMSNRPHIINARKTPWQLQLANPGVGSQSGIWVIPAGTGITDDQNQFLGVVAIEFDVVELSNKVQQKLSNNVSFVVLDNNNNVIIKSSDNFSNHDNNFYKENNVNRQFTQISDKLDKDIIVGDIRYSHYQKVMGYPYIILTGFKDSYLHQQFVNLVISRLIELALLTIFFLIALYLFKSRVLALLEIESDLSRSLDFANHDKSNILKTISQNLRNYIFSISGLVKMMRDRQAANQPEDKELTKTLSEQIAEISNFIEDLLDAEQIETGKFILGRIEECDIEELIQRAISFNQNLANNRKVIVNTQIESNLPKIKWDVRRLKQILINLLINAIKYSKAGSVVTISAKFLGTQKQICIEIADKGEGMSKEEIKRVLTKRDVKRSKNQGFGIWVVKQLIDLHKGKMEIESEEGSGTKIRLYFDVENQEVMKESGQIQYANEKQVSLNDKVILIVEDSPVNKIIIANILSKVGAKYYHAINGKEALEILDKYKIDLILMDGEMPIMNGYEAAREIRSGKCFTKFQNYKIIPIIALMGNDDEATLVKVKESGMNDHIGKSASPDKLLKLIDKYVNRAA